MADIVPGPPSDAKPHLLKRACAVLSLFWLTGVITTSLWVRPNAQDFPSYYMAGVIAQDGAWGDLYPLPIPGSKGNAGDIGASVMRPRYAQLANERGVGDAPRFIQPPPVALLYRPLAWLKFQTAYRVWMGLLILAGWLIALLAGEVYELARGAPSRMAGPIQLLVALSPLMYRTIRTGQVSCILGALGGLAIVGLARCRTTGPAVAIFLAALSKYAMGVWGALALLLGRWRVIAWMAAMTGLTALTVLITGLEPYRIYVHEILPTLNPIWDWRGNQSLSGMMIRLCSGSLPLAAVRAIRIGSLVLLAAILFLIWRRRDVINRSRPHLFAAAAALLLWWTISSPIFWEHYYVYFAPFWGWLIWEARGRTARIVAWAAIALMWAPLAVMPGFRLPEPFVSHMFSGAMLMMGLAVWRLSRTEKEESAASRQPLHGET